MLALPIVGDLRELAPHLSPLVVLHQLAVNVRNRLAAKADALSVDDLAGLVQALCVLVVLRHDSPPKKILILGRKWATMTV